MFTADELKVGAKRAVLQYLSDNGIPIAKIYSIDEAADLGPSADLIVRADGACQWDGFSGIFGSYKTKGNKLQLRGNYYDEFYTPSHFSLRELVALAGLDMEFDSGNEVKNEIFHKNISIKRGRISWYCEHLGISEPEKPSVLIQDAHSDSITMFQHPNNPNIVAIGMNNRTLLFYRHEDQFTYMAPHFEWNKGFFDGMPCIDGDGGDFGNLRMKIRIYDKILSLPKIAETKSIIEMESGWNRTDGSPVVYQVRMGRKTETANFRMPPESGKNIVNFDLPIGVTSSEGVRLKYTETIGSSDYSGLASMVFPFSSLSSNYPPHADMPGITALLFPIFDYRRDHGVREAVMKTPLAFCQISELDGIATEFKRGDKFMGLEYPNIRAQGLKMAEKLDGMLNEGQFLRFFADGLIGRLILE